MIYNSNTTINSYLFQYQEEILAAQDAFLAVAKRKGLQDARSSALTARWSGEILIRIVLEEITTMLSRSK